ncbi:MAG: hypothetical protein CL674_02915 [Bdellovibrionaceae bacterium]|nr:hypothetical protein [Pseudobdellovibrionaceae bacterium]|tara:strand:- start:176619 stop:177815 length:1197 start_codon:yes stop_codon:yes gene_type:complete
MDLEFLRTKISEKFESMEKFADSISVNRVTVSNWLRKKHEPESNRLFDIVDALELTPTEVDILMGEPPISVVFRKIGRTPSEKSVRSSSEEIADTFFKINNSKHPVRNNIYPITVRGVADPIRIANHIRNFLGLKNNEPVILNEVLVELKRNNIAVYFIPFKKLDISLPDNSSSHREVAFSAFKGDKKLIFLDTERTRDGITFDICHELAHILLDHRETTDDEEKLCNLVAQELVMPKDLINNNDEFTPFLNAKTPWSKMVNRFNHFIAEYDWSPKGLALALANQGLIKRGSHQFKKLMKLDSLWRSKQKTIDQIYFSNLVNLDFDTLVKFFSKTIYYDRDIFKPFLELKEAALEGRLSNRRLATLLNIDSGDAEELIRSWEEDISTEGPEVEQEQQS